MSVLGWIGKVFLEGVVIGGTATVVGGFVLSIAEPQFVERFLQPPTCDDPRDLVKVDVAEKLEEGDIVLETSTLQDPDHEGWSAAATFDGQPATGWVPHRDDETPTLTLRFVEQPIDLQMICAVNGVASTEWAYHRADRIRTAEVQSVSDAGPEANWHRAPLRTMPVGETQNRQQVGFQAGECEELSFRITDRYHGVRVFDPDVDKWVDATGLVALGELELFQDPPAST